MYKPEDILNLIKFNALDNKWKYNKEKKDLFAFQAEGVAGILNRFEKYKIALLADEVGMGKTIQALSVIAKQFEKKSKSKVLVIVPRKEMLNQWKNEEYKEFVSKHLIKDIMPNNNELIGLENLHKGFGISAKERQIIFCKTTSFSHISDNNIEELKRQIKEFDLIIVDEAHQYRNYENNEEDSLRIKRAKEIFGSKDKNTNTLLMTATPLHSRRGDIKRVVQLFKEIGQDDEEIMGKIMIRRLKIMTEGANKYQYRYEEDIPISLSDKEGVRNELFYAMLQKSFVYNGDNKDLSKSKHLLDYLEGTDFSENDFSKYINKIIKKYNKEYNIPPSNQKYDTVLKKILDSKEKALVFVRRKASANELSRRYIEAFDEVAWKIIDEALDKKIIIKMPKNREGFEKIVKNHKSDSIVNIDNVKEHIDDDFIEDYRKKEENKKGKHKETIKNAIAYNYFSQYDIFSKENFEEFKKSKDETEESKEGDTPKSIVLNFFKQKRGEPSTHASRFVLKFTKNKEYKNFFSQYLPEFLKYDTSKSELIKNAVLYSSIGVVELYAIFLKSGRSYNWFIKRLEKEEENLIFIKEVREFIKHYDKFEKYVKTNDNAVFKDEEEPKNDDEKVIISKIFNNAQPAYPYLSDTKNKHVIARFNSPFFPYMLCGTSILQEGVNLHLFCNKVYHFGSAHTMGDDEQRTGRVDRVMGKMDRELSCKDPKQKKLKIYYPYLKNTFDETNLHKMLTHKRATEINIDTCKIPASAQDDIIYQKSDRQLIKDLLHQTEKEIETEPYSWELEISNKT